MIYHIHHTRNDDGEALCGHELGRAENYQTHDLLNEDQTPHRTNCKKCAKIIGKEWLKSLSVKFSLSSTPSHSLRHAQTISIDGTPAFSICFEGAEGYGWRVLPISYQIGRDGKPFILPMSYCPSYTCYKDHKIPSPDENGWHSSCFVSKDQAIAWGIENKSILLSNEHSLEVLMNAHREKLKLAQAAADQEALELKKWGETKLGLNQLLDDANSSITNITEPQRLALIDAIDRLHMEITTEETKP